MAANEFFTMTSVTSLAVASSAVNIVSNALYRFAKFDQKITAFITGLIIAYLNVFIKTSPHWAEWLIAFINGCLLFCTAMGMNDLAESSKVTKRFTPKFGHEKEPFFNSWHKKSSE